MILPFVYNLFIFNLVKIIYFFNSISHVYDVNTRYFPRRQIFRIVGVISLKRYLSSTAYTRSDSFQSCAGAGGGERGISIGTPLDDDGPRKAPSRLVRVYSTSLSWPIVRSAPTKIRPFAKCVHTSRSPYRWTRPAGTVNRRFLVIIFNAPDHLSAPRCSRDRTVSARRPRRRTRARLEDTRLTLSCRGSIDQRRSGRPLIVRLTRPPKTRDG